jgi:hypothetical protein
MTDTEGINVPNVPPHANALPYDFSKTYKPKKIKKKQVGKNKEEKRTKTLEDLLKEVLKDEKN